VGSLHRLFELADGRDWAVSIPYALALGLAAVEITWLAHRPGPARRAVLRASATAGAMGVGALVVGVGYAAVLRPLWSAVGSLAPEGLAGFWRAHPVAGAMVAFVAWDLALFLYHWIGHHTAVGWAAHQPHHSGVDYDVSLGFRQTWVPFHGLAVQPLVALLGLDLDVILICAAVSNSWQMLIHTSVPVRFPDWFDATVMTPASHRQHHGRDGGSGNLGAVFTIWDRLAGSWVPGSVPAPVAYGPSDSAVVNPVSVELAGWRQLYRLWAPVLRPFARA
jgi:sterol desaturase/sphingolipid hydroxylase (fatty acid hydroxylase superfamily)